MKMILYVFEAVKPTLCLYQSTAVFMQLLFVDRLRVDVPWTSLYSEPTVVQIDGVLIVLKPNTGMCDRYLLGCDLRELLF